MVAHQAPLSMEFSRQEYWSGLPFPTPGDLRNPGIEPMSLASPALAGGFFTTEPPGEAHTYIHTYINTHGMCVNVYIDCTNIEIKPGHNRGVTSSGHFSLWPYIRNLPLFPAY